MEFEACPTCHQPIPTEVDITPPPTRPCLFCDKQLESVGDDWKYNQPHDGGEIQFVFSYGSREFDDCIGTTSFSALICDDCATKYVDKMTKKLSH